MNLFFPTTVTDNILPNPDAVREFALQQEYFASDNNSWPGRRTRPLSEIAPKLDSDIVKVVLAHFWDVSDLQNQKINVQVDTRFQLIGGSGGGWVHTDSSICTSIIYLTPGLSADFGTTIYEPVVASPITTYTHARKESYRDNVVTPYSEENRLKHTSQFKESITIKNKYNRMITFDGHLYHSGDAPTEVTSNNTQRLTLISFFYDVSGKILPAPRIRKTMYLS